MTSSGTYSFSPSAADLVLNAFGKLQIRSHELSAAHLQDAAMEANLLMIDISNRNPNRWLMETQTVPLVLAAPTYNLAARTISVTVATLNQTGAGDRTIGPISAADYASYPVKTQPGPPSAYLFNLAVVPTITVWPVPDAAVIAAGGVLSLMTFRQAQDVNLASGETIDSPYRFLDAFTTGLASRLAEIYRPEKAGNLNVLYEQRFARAQKRDQENVPISIAPNFSGYYR